MDCERRRIYERSLPTNYQETRLCLGITSYDSFVFPGSETKYESRRLRVRESGIVIFILYTKSERIQGKNAQVLRGHCWSLRVKRRRERARTADSVVTDPFVRNNVRHEELTTRNNGVVRQKDRCYNKPSLAPRARDFG